MKAKGSAMARSVFVSTLLPQAPRPPSQCVTSPTQALFGPLQLPVIEPDVGWLAQAAEVVAAQVVDAAGVKPPAGLVGVRGKNRTAGADEVKTGIRRVGMGVV